MKLFIVRHGETVGNAAKTHQTNETPLNDVGKEQAAKVAQRFRNQPIDVILTSPASRARETAKAISEITHASTEYIDEFQELRTPSEVHNKNWKDSSTRSIWEKIEKHMDDPEFHFSDEENNWDFIKRISTALREIEKRPEETIVLVSHGFVVRTIVGLILFGTEFSSRQFQQLKQTTQTNNTGVTICEFTTEHGWKLIAFNDHAHLLES